MKKTAFFLLILSTLYLILSTPVFAQVLTFERAYRDYQYNLSVYDQAYSDFQNAKNAYLQGGKTLSLKETARQKTYIMLVNRDQLIAVYLTALRTKISESTGLSPDDKNSIFGKIDAEVNFYTNHAKNYKGDQSLDQFFSDSGQSQAQYKNTTSLVVSEALFDISLGQVAALRISHEETYSALKSMIDSGVASGKLTLDPFNHWLTDIDATDSILKQNEAASRNQIAQIYNQNYTFQGGYNTAVETLTSSIKPLTQLNEFLTEVLNYIKNHE